MLNNQQFQENVNKKLQKGTLLPTIETFLLLWYFLGPTWNSHKHKLKKKVFCSIYLKILETLDRITMSQQHNMFHLRNSRDAQHRMNVAMI